MTQLVGKTAAKQIRRTEYGVKMRMLKAAQIPLRFDCTIPLIARTIDRIWNYKWILKARIPFEIRQWYVDKDRGIVHYKPLW